MLGKLPESLEIGGRNYEIDADFRNILQIFVAFEAEELSPQEKAYVCLKRLYVDFDEMPRESVEEAYNAALKFFDYGSYGEKKQRRYKLIDWEKDESIIFSAVNKAAGVEVRSLPFVHWWTFMGYFQSVDSESLMGTVLSIRQKKAKGKKLEKWEREFERNNRELCRLHQADTNETPEDSIKAMFQSLIAEGAVNHE